jgi:flagellar hook-length control protein FliK
MSTAQGLPQATEAQTKAASLREEAPLRELRHLSERNQPAQAPAAPQAAAPTQPSMTLAQAAMKQDTAREKLDLVALGAVDSEAWASPDTRSGQQTTAGGLSQLLARADTPAMIGRQMAEVLQRLPDRPVEIALNPKELGRVRMSISAAESGITVTVLAERPETLDLMRRNIDQLAREFQAIGYESINFAFSGGESRPEFSEGASEQSPAQISRLELTEAEDAPPVQDLSTAPTSGLDIRL